VPLPDLLQGPVQLPRPYPETGLLEEALGEIDGGLDVLPSFAVTKEMGA